MQTLLPSYYLTFRCVGGACKHSCCVDWEIDIDSQTLSAYESRTDALGARIRSSLCEEESVHFCLGEDGRCPFLNENNLCDIILSDGERALPEICREHPRFRNYYGDELVELGLGFACEQALSCALCAEELSFVIADGEIDSLSDLRAVSLRTADFDFAHICGYNGDFLREKYGVLSLLSHTDIPAEARISLLAEQYGVDTSPDVYSAFYSLLASLESLDPAWRGLLSASASRSVESAPNERFLRLLSLFVFRHANADSVYSLGAVLSFGLQLCRLAEHLSQNAQGSFSFIEIVRLLSSEIEYSEENTETLLDFCEQKGIFN